MTRVKICGLRDAPTAVAAARAGADMIGLVFAESRRRVSPQECHDIVAALHEGRREAGPAALAGPGPGEVSARTWFHAWSEALDDGIARYRPLVVGVFADQPVDVVNDIAEAAGLDLVQLSGGEPLEFAAAIARPVVLVRHIGPGSDASGILEDIGPGPVAVLLDTARGGERGGTGQVFDWEVAADVARRVPIVLAGGLDPGNVAEAVRTVGPWAVDVSSGVETNGSKDIEKIRAFISAAKGVRP